MRQVEGIRARRLRALWGLLMTVALATAAALSVVWPRDDQPDQIDAVVVLGGVGPERVRLGMALRDSYGAALVLSSTAVYFGEEVGLRCGDDVLCIQPVPADTRGEARTVARLAEEMGWRNIAVATTNFHTSRARVLFRQCLGTRVAVIGATPSDSRGLRTYLREVVGMAAAVTLRRAC